MAYYNGRSYDDDHRQVYGRAQSRYSAEYPTYEERYSRSRESRPRTRYVDGHKETIVKEYLDYPDGRVVDVSSSRGRSETTLVPRAPSPTRRLRRTPAYSSDDVYYTRQRRGRSYDALLEEPSRVEYTEWRPSTTDRRYQARRYNEAINSGRVTMDVTEEGKPHFINDEGIDDKYRIVSRKVRDVSPPPPEIPPRRYLPEERIVESRGRERRVMSPVRRARSPDRQRILYQYPPGYY